MPTQPRLLNVEHIPQETESGCLIACVQTVLRFVGRNVSQTELAGLLDLMPEGVPASRIKRVERLGFRVTYEADGDINVLKQALKQNMPPIVLVQTEALEYWSVNTDHAVVVIGIDDQTVHVNDPAFDRAPQTCSLEAFLLAWAEFENRYAIISA